MESLVGESSFLSFNWSNNPERYYTSTETTTASAKKMTLQVYSDEKANRLMQTFGTIVSISLLIGWLDIIIVRPAGDIADEMQHLDPSEIISVPFPLLKVAIFTLFPIPVLILLWTVKNPSTVVWKTLSLIKVTGLMFVVLGLCGNALVENWQHSTCAALYISALLCTNLTENRTSNIFEELAFYDQSNLLLHCRLYCTLAFIISCCILSILDHGYQLQRWPLPILLGATYGHTVGSIIGILGEKYKKKKNQ